MTPGLVTRGRIVWLAALMLSAIGQAAAAAAFAEVLGAALAAPGEARIMALLALIAALMAGASFAERLIGEIVAQSYIHSVRTALFEALIAHRGTTSEAQWLNPLINDLGALRNWAARGPVRLWTAAVALVLALGYFFLRYPQLVLAMLPFALCVSAVLLLAPPLRRAIREQRRVRGGLTRFIVRRARKEASGAIRGNRHGRAALAKRSLELGQRAVARARIFALLEGLATAAPAAALLAIVIAADSAGLDQRMTIAAIALLSFAGTRQLEIVRAVHASIGGQVARARIARVLHNAQTPKGDQYDQ